MSVSSAGVCCTVLSLLHFCLPPARTVRVKRLAAFGKPLLRWQPTVFSEDPNPLRPCMAMASSRVSIHLESLAHCEFSLAVRACAIHKPCALHSSHMLSCVRYIMPLSRLTVTQMATINSIRCVALPNPCPFSSLPRHCQTCWHLVGARTAL